MLLKQGDFQKQQPAPAHPSLPVATAQVSPRAATAVPSPDPEGRVRGFVAPSPAGGGQEVAGGSASHQHPRSSGEWVPCPFPVPGHGEGGG